MSLWDFATLIRLTNKISPLRFRALSIVADQHEWSEHKCLLILWCVDLTFKFSFHTLFFLFLQHTRFVQECKDAEPDVLFIGDSMVQLMQQFDVR